MNRIRLSGHSGCELSIEEKEGKLYVIKISRDLKYNDRLKKQGEKQIACKLVGFSAPKILRSEIGKDGRLALTMDYVNGMTLAEYFKKISLSSIQETVEPFLRLIPEKNIYDPEACKKFKDKLCELRDVIDLKEKVVDTSFTKLNSFDWYYCVKSQCHGDMTFENVIVSKEGLYLIDYLDSFYESWMVDLAKIYQDLQCFWSYRAEKKIDENLQIRLFIFKDLIEKKIHSLPEGVKIMETIYAILELNLLRILPYTKDKETKGFIYNALTKLNTI